MRSAGRTKCLSALLTAGWESCGETSRKTSLVNIQGMLSLVCVTHPLTVLTLGLMKLRLRSEYGCPKSSKGGKSGGQSEAYGSKAQPSQHSWLPTLTLCLHTQKGKRRQSHTPDPIMDPVPRQQSRNRKSLFKYRNSINLLNSSAAPHCRRDRRILKQEFRTKG